MALPPLATTGVDRAFIRLEAASGLAMHMYGCAVVDEELDVERFQDCLDQFGRLGPETAGVGGPDGEVNTRRTRFDPGR